MLSFEWNQRGGVVTFSNLFLRRRDVLQENDRLRREWASPTDEVFGGWKNAD
jgi:hypothetical protein